MVIVHQEIPFLGHVGREAVGQDGCWDGFVGAISHDTFSLPSL